MIYIAKKDLERIARLYEETGITPIQVKKLSRLPRSMYDVVLELLADGTKEDQAYGEELKLEIEAERQRSCLYSTEHRLRKKRRLEFLSSLSLYPGTKL